MGAGASASAGGDDKFNEEQCQEIFGDLFDPLTFKALCDAEGHVTGAQLLNPRKSLRTKAADLESFHASASMELSQPNAAIEAQAAVLVADDEAQSDAPEERGGAGGSTGGDGESHGAGIHSRPRDGSEGHTEEKIAATERRAYESQLEELEATGRRIMLGIVDEDFGEDLVSKATAAAADGNVPQLDGPEDPATGEPVEPLAVVAAPVDAANEVVAPQHHLDWAPLRKELGAAMTKKESALEIVKRRGVLLQHVSAELRADKDVVLAAVAEDSRALEFASETLQEDWDVAACAVHSASGVLAAETKDKSRDDQVLAAAITEGWVPFRHAPKAVRNEKHFALTAVAAKGASLEFASKERRADREVVLAAVTQNGKAALPHAAEALQADREVAFAAVAECRGSDLHANLSQVVDSLRANKQIVTAAVTKEGSSALRCAAPSLRDDKDVVSVSVRREGRSLQHASEALRADKDVCMLAVRQDGCALCYAADAMKDDLEVVTAAVQQDFRALYYAGPKRRSDRDVVIAAIRAGGDHGWEALPFASHELRSDRTVVLEAAMLNPKALRFATPYLRHDPQFKKEVEEAHAARQQQQQQQQQQPQSAQA